MKISKTLYRYILGFTTSLFWICLLLNYLERTENANSVISYSPIVIESSQNEDRQLRKGDKYTVEFISNFPKMGIVSLRFRTYFRINSEKVTFKLKEKQSQDWYYQNTYNTDQFQPNELFTFGFPIIENSQGKSYVVEIESVQGKVGDAVSVSSDAPILITKHKYHLSELLNDKLTLMVFSKNKIMGLLSDNDFMYQSILYLLICIGLFIYGVFLYNFPNPGVVIGVLITILLDIFVLKSYYQILFLTIFLIWLYYKIKSDLPTDSMVGIVIVLMAIGIILKFTDSQTWYPKASAWVYIMMSGLLISKFFKDSR